MPLALVLTALLWTLGCSDDSTGARAEFGGPHSLAFSGQSLFVAATTDSRLRVIDLSARKVVRAPNPIFPLAVPTVALPQVVASYRSPDATVSSPFAFALSTVEPRISVLSASRHLLMGELTAPALPLSMDVRALAAESDDTVVYVTAMVDGAGALFSLSVPADLAEASIDPSLVALTPETEIDIAASIPHLVVASPTDPARLAIVNRALGTDAGVLLVDMETKHVTPIDVGGPVASLAFDTTGARLFGLIDSDTCLLSAPSTTNDGEPDDGADDADGADDEATDPAPDGSARAITPGSQGPQAGLGLGACTGLFAIDVERAALVEGSPLRVPGLLRGVAVGGAVTLTVPGDTKREIDPLVLVTSIEGALYPVDGATLTLIDAQNSEASVSVAHVEPNGKSTFSETAPSDITITEGRVTTETVSILYEGLLPDLTKRQGQLEADGLTSAGTNFAALGVEPGDRLDLVDITKDDDPCAAFTITAVDVGKLSIAAGVGAECQGLVSYGVRASEVYVVSGKHTGLMGRVVEGEDFEFWGEPLYDVGEEIADAPALAFRMTGSDPRVDAGWTIAIESGVAPFAVPISSLIMPGAIACDRATNDFYVVYQGGNAVLRIEPTKLRHNSVSTSNGLSVFR
jgi:hypothetical protein